MHGRIVDASTGQPIVGARISVHDHTSTTTTSDATGAFRFHSYHNFHLGYLLGICPTDWPEGSDWDTVLDVSHPDYEPFRGDVDTDLEAQIGETTWSIRDILLVPKPP